MIKRKIISAFQKEFHFVQEKFELMDLLANNSPMDYDVIDNIQLPSEQYNIVWHPGVYVFIGNNTIYRVGVSMRNSRWRVMQHLEACTSKNGYCIWDIEKCEDKSILLFNVKNISDRHWLLALEAYLEDQFSPLINASRIG
jgi:hypothetical protein